MKQNLRIRTFYTLFLLLLGSAAQAQYKISGTVIDNKNKPLRGANVYLENTIDGGTTDSLGIFRFTTSEKGPQTIVASEVGHENGGQPLEITGDMSGIVITLKSNKVHDLDAVVITAGSFDASNDKTKTVLKPLDIVTTAGANADVVKAMQMLPGTQQTGTENGLFVRGGDANEAAIIVDETIVQNAFFSGPPGMATRSRFGAFQYQGMSFSSGGYGARYGQALSGVLELTSTDLADKSTVNLGANMSGVYASGTKKWKHSSLDVGGNYTNLAPFYGLATTNFKFYKVPVGGGGNARYVWLPNKNGIFKATVTGSYFSSGIAIPNPVLDTQAINPFSSQGNPLNFVTRNANYYSNVSYRQMFKNKYSLYTAASFSLDQTKNEFGTIPINQEEHREQFRIEGKDFITTRLSLLVGSDVQRFGLNRKMSFPGFDTTYTNSFVETIPAAYAELQWTPIYWLAIRPGVRYEHSTLLKSDNIAPRLSLAIKSGSYSQVSIASGTFYQEATSQYLLAGYRPQMQEAIHYIANWQWSKDSRTLRLEGYYKDYRDLILENTTLNSFNPNTYRFTFDSLSNGGYGYAKGLELFWRDKKTVKNLDYWVSYSYIDTKRKYNNFLAEATPSFISDHNLNIVSKYFIEKIQTNISATYSYASGRPYYDPKYAANGTESAVQNFMTGRTPEYHNLAISAAYLHTFGKWFTVFYVSVDNVTNRHNIFGYRYTANGTRIPIVPALYRTIFVGVNMSLTQFSKDEL